MPDDGRRAPDAPPGFGVHRPTDSGPPTQRLPYAGSGPYEDPSAGAPVRPAGPPASGRGGWRRPRRWRRVAAVLLVVLVGYPLALLAVAWISLNRTAALGDTSSSTPGRTYLVVGSDSRAGLSPTQRKALRTGTAPGQRTDTILLLHVPASGGPTVLMSVPRDSYVRIPGHGHDKINAAFSLGGPRLLAQTIKVNTGIVVDDYVEIGFGGFAGMVDALGGVQICPKVAIKDHRAGLNIPKGCQQANGATALGYARARYFDPLGDLGRVQRQRELVAAIIAKASSPATLVNPFRTFPLAVTGGRALTVDNNTGPISLVQFLLGIKRGAGPSGVSLTVPVAGTANRGAVGSVVLWDPTKSAAVFDAIKRDDTAAVRALAGKRG